MQRPSDPTAGIEKLAASLRPVLALETALGNTVKAVEIDVWTACPLAVVMTQPLHFDEIGERLKFPETVERWENRDTHYSVERGLLCRETRHTIAGPIPAGQ
jgi:hypothetical protein